MTLKRKKSFLSTALALSVVSYNTVHSSEVFSFIPESQDRDSHSLSASVSKTTEYNFGSLIPETEDETLNSVRPQTSADSKTARDQLDEALKSALAYQVSELDFFDVSLKPANTSMVSERISLDEVKRARLMSEIAYEGSQLKPTRLKAQALVDEHEKIIRSKSGLSEENPGKKARSRLHFFGENSQQEGCIVEDVDGAIYIAYRGTEGLNLFSKEWRNNYKVWRRGSRFAPGLKDEDGNKVSFHSGFLNRVENTFEEIISVLEKIAHQRGQKVQDLSLTVTGHSKGAGAAQVATLLLANHYKKHDIKTVTFAPPRSLNSAGARLYHQLTDSENNVSVMQSYDTVTAVGPGFLGYKHISDENRLYVPRMGMMHMISDYDQGLDLMGHLRQNNYVLKDDMGNIYTGQGDTGRGNALIRGLWNVLVRTKNLFTWNKSINYIAVPADRDSLLTQEDFDRTLPEKFGFIKYSSTPYEVVYKTNIQKSDLNEFVLIDDTSEEVSKPINLTVKAPSEASGSDSAPAPAPAQKGWWGKLKSKIWG